MAGSKGDVVAKIIVIILIAVFLGIAAFTMLGGKSAPAGGPPSTAYSGGPPAGAGAGQVAAGQGAQGAAAGGTQGAGVQAARAPTEGGTPAADAAEGQAASGQGGQAARGQGQQGAQGQAGGTAGRQTAANAITVSAKTMKGESIQQVIKLNGDVSPQSEVSIFPDTSGKIVRILKDLGDTVRQGDIIAYIDPSRPGAAYVESPVICAVGGTITSLPVTEGLTVSQSTAIAIVGSLDKLKITIYVAEKYSAYLRQNLPAYVSFSSAPGAEFDAKVSTVSPVVNNKNRTIETTLNLGTQDPRIKEGMFASVRLVIREERNTLVIPRSAIKDYNGNDTVYIIDENETARRIPITIGLTNDSEVQIISGLGMGDRVITAGAVTDGSPVRIAAASL
jgi:multidrug efflux pump subunit AcrA (membrane-fusion protein)